MPPKTVAKKAAIMNLSVPEWIWNRIILVAYLYPPPIDFAGKWGELIKIKPNEKFYAVVGNYLHDFVEHKKMPPDEIAAPIINLADDYRAGRPMTLKTGDYIVLQNFVRKSR